MNTLALIIGVIALIAVTGFIYVNFFTASGNTTITVPSDNVETASTSVQATTDSFVNSATPTSDQVVPDPA